MLRQTRQNVHPEAHQAVRLARLGLPGTFDLLEDVPKLVTHERGNDGRRRFVRTEAMIVARMGDRRP